MATGTARPSWIEKAKESVRIGCSAIATHPPAPAPHDLIMVCHHDPAGGRLAYRASRSLTTKRAYAIGREQRAGTGGRKVGISASNPMSRQAGIFAIGPSPRKEVES